MHIYNSDKVALDTENKSNIEMKASMYIVSNECLEGGPFWGGQVGDGMETRFLLLVAAASRERNVH